MSSELQTADEREVCTGLLACSLFLGLTQLQIADQELLLHQEESDSIQDRLEELFEEHTRGDFMEADDSPIAKHAAEIANAHITGGTRKAQRR